MRAQFGSAESTTPAAGCGGRTGRVSITRAAKEAGGSMPRAGHRRGVGKGARVGGLLG